MNRAPKIGQRVKYHRWGGLIGVVTKITPTYDDEFDDDDNFVRRLGIRPENKWHVHVKVDYKTPQWPYPNTDVFCPLVEEVDLE